MVNGKKIESNMYCFLSLCAAIFKQRSYIVFSLITNIGNLFQTIKMVLQEVETTVTPTQLCEMDCKS